MCFFFPGKQYIVYIYLMKYHSAIKKKEIMLFAATWMKLEITILSEKEKYHRVSLICGI